MKPIRTFAAAVVLMFAELAYWAWFVLDWLARKADAEFVEFVDEADWFDGDDDGF